MPALSEEGLAGIRLLVCMARADGVMKPDERFALEDTLAGVELPDGVSVEKLLAETHDPHALAVQIHSPEARDYAYASVFSLAYCDRELAAPEQKILDVLRAAWNVKPEEDQALGKALDRGKQAEKPAEPLAAAVSDPAARAATFDKLLTRYCILTGLTGAIPIPLVPDLMVVPIQVKMVHDIAALFGHTTDKRTVQLMFETLAVGTGARIGVTMLSKMIPGWGSVVGASTSYATTFALGKVAWAFFESEGKKSIESLKLLFREEQTHGKAEYQKHQAALDEARKAHSHTLEGLAYDLQQGRITQKQYEEKVDALQ